MQESHWILEGIQPNLLTGDVRGIESWVPTIILHDRFLWGRNHCNRGGLVRYEMLTTAPYKTITQIVYHHHLFYEIITISRFMKHYETKQNHNVLFKKNMLCIPRPFLRETHHIQKAGINCIQGSPIRLTCLTNGFKQKQEESKEKARKWLYYAIFCISHMFISFLFQLYPM